MMMVAHKICGAHQLCASDIEGVEILFINKSIYYSSL